MAFGSSESAPHGFILYPTKTPPELSFERVRVQPRPAQAFIRAEALRLLPELLYKSW